MHSELFYPLRVTQYLMKQFRNHEKQIIVLPKAKKNTKTKKCIRMINVLNSSKEHFCTFYNQNKYLDFCQKKKKKTEKRNE